MDSERSPLSNLLCITHWENYRSQTLPTDSTDEPLFPMLREEVGPLTAQHERLIIVLDVARIEAFVQMWPGLPGRPLEDRHALARAFVAKAVLDLPTTSGLIERLAVDAVLRRLCGFERA